MRWTWTFALVGAMVIGVLCPSAATAGEPDTIEWVACEPSCADSLDELIADLDEERRDLGCCGVDESTGRFIQLLGGAYWQGDLGPDASPRFDFVHLAARFGIRPIQNGGWLEHGTLMLELNVSPVFQGPGSIFGGVSVLGRLDLCDRRHAIVPYVQCGAGIAFTDAHEDRSQAAIGRSQSFLLQAQGGVRFALDRHWSLDAEGGWIHLSNADLNDRNGGTNGLGGSLGLTRSF